MSAEKILWRAVLNQAVIDFASPGYVYGLGTASMQRSAGEWFLSNSHNLGSFIFVCEVFNTNLEWFRKQLLGTSTDTLKNRLATQHRSRDRLASVAAFEEEISHEPWHDRNATRDDMRIDIVPKCDKSSIERIRL